MESTRKERQLSLIYRYLPQFASFIDEPLEWLSLQGPDFWKTQWKLSSSLSKHRCSWLLPSMQDPCEHILRLSQDGHSLDNTPAHQWLSKGNRTNLSCLPLLVALAQSLVSSPIEQDPCLHVLLRLSCKCYYGRVFAAFPCTNAGLLCSTRLLSDLHTCSIVSFQVFLFLHGVLRARLRLLNTAKLSRVSSLRIYCWQSWEQVWRAQLLLYVQALPS